MERIDWGAKWCQLYHQCSIQYVYVMANLEGLQITVHSFKEVCKYLLHNGVKFILSKWFCQDDLENYFGRQRAIGARKNNPSVKDVGYNDNTINSQFSIRLLLVMFVVMVTNLMSLMKHPCRKRRNYNNKASKTKSREWALITAKTVFY